MNASRNSSERRLVEIPYVKMHGCRNDYIFVDLIKNQLPTLQNFDLAELSKKVSNRKSGIGSDGLILVGKSNDPQFDGVMVMFNADGSQGKMCGNGIRCVAKLLHESIGPKPSYKIMTDSGLRECFVIKSENSDRMIVKVNMGRPSFLPAKIPVLFDDVMVMNEEFEVGGREFRISCVSMGNPHCVVQVEDLDHFPVHEFGPLFEKHEVFPEGVNVEFIEIKDGKIYQRTWERGSGETQACGTGACAVAVAAIMGKKHPSPVEIHLKGGTLTVEWDGLREVWLTGEAVTETSGTVDTRKLGFNA